MLTKVMMGAALVLSSGAQAEGLQSVDNFRYDEHDALPGTMSLPDPAVNGRPQLGEKNVLVTVTNWQGENTLDKTKIEKHTLSTDVDSLRSYITAASKGKLTLNGRVVSYTSGPRPQGCKPSGQVNQISLATAEGLKAAAANGIDPKSVDYWINVIDCHGGASAWMPGNTMGVYGMAGGPHVYKHEFGHNLGYAHGSTYTRCPRSGDIVNAPTGCSMVGYGDTGDSVSGGGTLYPAFNRWYSGWLDDKQAATIKSTGLYRLGVLGGSGPQLYLIERPGDGARTVNYLSLEYRKPTIFDDFEETDNRVNGVWARFSTIVYYNNFIMNTQLDGTPETATTADPALLPGKILKDEPAGITVAVCSASDKEATIAVGVSGESAPSCDVPYLSTPRESAVTGPAPIFSGGTALLGSTVVVITAGNPSDVLATTKSDDKGNWSVRSKELKGGTKWIQVGQALNGQPTKWSEPQSFHVRWE
ncbi:hypothetical protein PS645_01768 [Pseudomonas fluorescens]|uniref:Peptidase M11 gametolysin domain-containing protein n=1 Tax=Pseudomonas fluorescens TaxID=294 RepID=A0A5E6RWP8_PSEFL|nr:transposase [Pseudomonas fluorescens]VVM71083.1 hypothetical protein PS645_01768 [Pseudomonas fluorescens]